MYIKAEGYLVTKLQVLDMYILCKEILKIGILYIYVQKLFVTSNFVT